MYYPKFEEEKEVCKLIKGVLKNTENGWVIYHNISDPYGQIPHPLPLHKNSSENLIEGLEVEFYVVFEYYGKLSLSNVSFCNESRYTVWVGGVEVNDKLLNESEANNLADEYKIKGYDDVVVEKTKA